MPRKKRRNTKSSIRRRLLSFAVVLVLGGAAGYTGWLFWSELNRAAENVGGITVGKVASVRGQTQRKFANRAVWSTLGEREEVFDLDAIRTGPESLAEILLSDGTVINLEPDTYIILDLGGGNRNIEFVGGAISAVGGAEGTGDLTVSSEGTVVSLEDAAISLTRRVGEETSVAVTEGEAMVLTAEGTTAVGTDAVLRIDEATGRAAREDLTVRPLEPRINSRLVTFDETRTVNFSWELLADWDDTRLEIAPDALFIDDVARVPGTGAATAELAEGVWYWRIAGLGPDGADVGGPVGAFTVDQDRPTTPRAPSRDGVIPFRTVVPPVTFQWDRSFFADTHLLEVGRGVDLDTPFLSREVEGSSLLVDNLGEGSWWWRVTPVYRRAQPDNLPETIPSPFVIEKRSGHDPTVAVSPPDGSVLSALEVREGVPFRWQASPDFSGYLITVARDEEFNEIVLAADTRENWLTALTAPEPGDYWWRVEATAVDGLPVPPSEPGSFTVERLTGAVELVDPPAGSVLEVSPYSPYRFSWRSAVPGQARFILSRRNGEARQRLMENLTSADSITVPLPGDGEYAWKIQILDDNGRILIESPEADFNLAAPFGAPALRVPAPGTTLSLVGRQEVDFQWDPIPGADAYTFRLSGPGDVFIDRADRITGFERLVEIPADVGEGTYRVELRSLRDDPAPGSPESSEPGVYEFTVGELVRYAAPVPRLPANGASIPYLDVLRDGVELAWTQEPSLDRWTVEISAGGVDRIYQVTEPRLFLEGLEPGSYSWKILSRDSFGQEAPDSPTSRFRIAPLPDLETPRFFLPPEGGDVDMTTADSLLFRWAAVPDAEFYDLALYISGSGTPVFRETGLRNTSFAFRDLERLDVGGFFVVLEARTEFPELGITQRSPETRIDFSLSLAVGDSAPTILTDELQYAP